MFLGFIRWLSVFLSQKFLDLVEQAAKCFVFHPDKSLVNLTTLNTLYCVHECPAYTCPDETKQDEERRHDSKKMLPRKRIEPEPVAAPTRLAHIRIGMH